MGFITPMVEARENSQKPTDDVKDASQLVF